VVSVSPKRDAQRDRFFNNPIAMSVKPKPVPAGRKCARRRDRRRGAE
jgi:hypothetical protein